MYRRSPISLCKLFTRRPLHQSTSPNFFELLTSESNICNFYSVSAPKPKLPTMLTSTPHYFMNPNSSNAAIARQYCADSVADFDQNKVVDEINLKFAEAREEIETAMESKETVYFDEEAECARSAVKEVLDMFEGLLAKLPEGERAALKRSMGLKIEQLKAEIQQLDD